MKLSSVTAAVLLLSVVFVRNVVAAPFAETIEYTQPNGEVVQLWGKGDEFHAVFETLDGYTVVFDTAQRAYFYAALNADGSELVSTGVAADNQPPAGLTPHLRVDRAVSRERALNKRHAWEEETGIVERWNLLKTQTRILESQMEFGPIMLAPPSQPTIGEITGIVLLIDFDDDVRIISKTEIEQFCNLPGYAGYGNNGSVRDYFYEVSNGMLQYTNVVLQYVRIPNSLHPKSYYTDSSRDFGESANELINDALNILTAQPGFATEVAPLIDRASLNGQGQALALNVFYAGGNGGVWSAGLWPHMWGLYETGAYQLTDRTRVFTYQITNMGSSLAIGTFCHENGHMICGYPDLYDYGYDSTGGAGQFCIMGTGGHGTNPSQVCGYLKYKSGWTTTIEVPPYQYEAASLAARTSHPDYNKIYRTPKPNVDTEYFLFESRSRIDRDSNLPGAGLLIWHIDELGDRDNQSMAYNDQHENYECTLVQADGLYHFQNYANDGDVNDPWYAGNTAPYYVNSFSDNTRPSAKWWDGTDSHMRIMNISPLGEVMSFEFIPPAPLMLSTPGALPKGREWAYYSYNIGVFGASGVVNWNVIEGELPPGLNIGTESGVISGYPLLATNTTFKLEVMTSYNVSSTNTYSILIQPVHTIPFEENFEVLNGALPDSWTQSYLANAQPWKIYQSLHDSFPLKAQSPTNFVALFQANTNDHVTLLTTPRIDFGDVARAGRLSFYHYMANWIEVTDKLNVYYKTSLEGEWQLLESYTDAVTEWTQRVIDLPEISRSMYIAFEGTAHYGRGVCVDSVQVWDPTPPFGFTTDSPLPNAIIDEPYEFNLQVEGGVTPYTFTVVSNTLPAGLLLTYDGIITGTATALGTFNFTVQSADDNAELIYKNFTVTVTEGVVNLFEEDFENYGQLPYGWTQEFVESQTEWIANPIGYQSHPPAPQQGDWHAYFWKNTPKVDGIRTTHTTRLVSPQINMGQSPGNITLHFWHHMQIYDGDQDTLKVLYRNTIEGEWTEIAHYTQDTPQWTQRSLMLPDPSTTYYIAFEGNARFGYGICIDNMRITDESTAPIITTDGTLPFGYVGESYETTLQASGGAQPYLWELVDGQFPEGLTLSTDGTLSGVAQSPYLDEFYVRVLGANGFASTNRFELKIKMIAGIPFFEGFENGGTIPEGWSQEYVTGPVDYWGFVNGSISDRSSRRPTSAFEGSYNASLFSDSKAPSVMKLITPVLNLGYGVSNVVLTFQHHMEEWLGDQDFLKVYYRNSTNGTWVLLESFEQSTSTWSERSIALPNLSDTYFIAFEAWGQYGYGVHIDNVAINGDMASPMNDWLTEYFTPQDIEDGLITGFFDDPDGDGIDNIWEYAYDLDPLTFNTEGLPIGVVSNNYLNIIYRQNKAAVDIEFQVEATSNLVTGVWSVDDLSEILRVDMGDWWEVTVRHDVPVTDAPARFMRLKLIVY